MEKINVGWIIVAMMIFIPLLGSFLISDEDIKEYKKRHKKEENNHDNS